MPRRPRAPTTKTSVGNSVFAERTRELTNQINDIKKEMIVECAVELFSSQGYHETTIDNIASKLGVGKPHIYNFFKSKLDILAEVAGRGTNEVHAAVSKEAAIPGSAENALRRVVHAFTEYALLNHNYVSVYFRENMYLPAATRKDLLAKRKEIDLIVQKIIQDGIESGEFIDCDSYLTSLSINGMISYSFAWYRKGGGIAVETICDLMCNQAIKLLKKPGSRRSPG